MTAAERKRVRSLESKPVLDDFYTWILKNKDRTRPRSLARKAMDYTFNEWEYLVKFLEEGFLEIDNNGIENSIRPFTVGRKNWLFSDTVEGAHASANIYSLLETAKLNKINPYDYLKFVIERLPQADSLEDYEELLPLKYKSTMG